LGHIKVYFGPVCFINFVIDLVVKLRYGLQTVLTSIDHNASFGLDLISHANLLLISSKLSRQMFLELLCVMPKYIPEGNMQIKQGFACAEGNAPLERALDIFEEMQT
jgi:hypothetical protein